MNYQKLELHIAQIERALEQFRCKFPDKKKQTAYNNLLLLFNKIKQSNYKIFTEDQLAISRIALNEIFFGMEHLHYGSLFDIPEEMIFCLGIALEDWMDDHSNFLIITSLNNKIEEFYLKGNLNKVYQQNIKSLFAHDLDQTLIKIGKPKLLLNDFLSGVALYHELGHFIDFYYQISETIIRYEPNLSYLSSRPQNEVIETYNHYLEFFADLFAAQYIGNSLSEYINYISFKAGNSFTHPSTSRRLDIVDAFLNGRNTPEIDYIKKWTPKRSSGRLIEMRNIPLSKDPFVNGGQVIKLGNIREVHSLFPKAWENWLSETSSIRVKFSDPTLACDAINKITKESIRLMMPKKFFTIADTWPILSNKYSTMKRCLFQR